MRYNIEINKLDYMHLQKATPQEYHINQTCQMAVRIITE